MVGTVASFKRHKGHRHLLEAADRVRREVPEVRFVLVGHGPLEGAIRRQARELALDETLVLAGYREDAAAVAATFDVFALSSVYEGLSIALMEAMALGKPVVVTEVGGLPEVVEHGKQGLVVRSADAPALADGILELLGDAGLRRRLGEGGRRAGRQLRHPARGPPHRSGLRRAVGVRATAVSGAPGVRHFRDEDEPQVLELLRAALGTGPIGGRTPELFAWKHRDGPFGPSLMLVAEQGERIVGFRAFMRWRFRAGDRTLAAVRAVDTATHPDHQRTGCFLAAHQRRGRLAAGRRRTSSSTPPTAAACPAT